MVALLSGNEAFARGAYEAGVVLVSSYPGTPSTEITERIKKYKEVYTEWATNEKVALEVAAGASLSGKRSLTCMKHVGLNVAADPMMTLSYTGVNGGLVVVVCDDPGMFSSQNEQDSRHYARFSKLPMLEPSDSDEAKRFIIEAFNISEKYCCPVLVRSTTRISHSKSKVKIGDRNKSYEKPIEKNLAKWVMVPANARKRHIFVEERLLKLQHYVEKSALNKIEYNSKKLGIICSGIVYQYVKEALPDASIFKIATIYPLPFKKIKEFIKNIKNVYIIEELDPFIEKEIRAEISPNLKLKRFPRSFCNESSTDMIKSFFEKKSIKTNDNKLKSISNTKLLKSGISENTTKLEILRDKNCIIPDLPERPPNLCPGCAHRGIFYAIKKLALFVTGDIGCYTLGFLSPLNAIHACICMGASISMAHGIDRATSGEYAKNTVAVIGDSTFFHTGINGLINAIYNAGSSTIIILNNSTTAMTGHQPNPGTGITIKGDITQRLDFFKIAQAMGIRNISVLDPLDIDQCVETLKKETQNDELSLIITNRACIYVDRSIVSNPYFIDKEKCTGCQMCIKIGCPSISFSIVKKLALIDETLCTGCSLCVKVCKFNAIITRYL